MIAVVGATGTMGRLLVAELTSRSEPGPRSGPASGSDPESPPSVVRSATDLASRGELVRAVAHNPEAVFAGRPGVEAVAADVATPDGAARAVAGARVVVSAITGFASPAGVMGIDSAANQALARAAAAAGVEHFILLSVGRAAPDSPIDLFRAKAQAEQAVRDSGVAWTIIRPTAYAETWLGLVGGPLVATGKTMVFGRGRNPINFVSALDIARFVRRAIEDPTMRGEVVEVPGPENLTIHDLIRLVENVSGRQGTVSHIPRTAMRIFSRLLRPLNAMRAGQMAAAVMMDTADMTIDGPAIRAAYPSIPMIRAAEVAGTMFGGARVTGDRQVAPG